MFCKGSALAIKVYRKPTHTGCYLNFKSNHPLHVKRGIIQSLHNKASTTCQEWQDLFNDIDNLRCDLKLNHYSFCSLLQLLIPRVQVIQKRVKASWLCLSPLWMAFQRSLNVYGIIKILGQSSKPNPLLRIHTWERDWKYISNRWHIVPTAFPVNVTEATLVKQANYYLCSSMNTRTIRERVF
jgi:hypothetical protein